MNQRAIEAGALAMLKWMHGQQAEFEHFAPGIKAGLLEQAQECITAYEAHMKADGFVVVRAEPTDAMLEAAYAEPESYWHHDPCEFKAEWMDEMKAIYRAMLSAATTGENDASDR